MTTLTRLEDLVRAGEFAKAGAMLADLNTKKISRAEMASYANLANRADHSRWAFQLLNPIVRSTRPLFTPPSEHERIEYAEALRRMGLIDEALEILEELDSVRHPIVNLRKAFCLFRKWRYAEAVPYLQAFIAAEEDGNYLATIAKVNLAAAFVHIHSDEQALDLLQQLQENTRKQGLNLLLGNTLELTAQIHIRRRDWTQADGALTQAERIFVGLNNKYSLYVAKWRAIASSLMEGRVHRSLLDCRTQAQARGEWETQRDCDLYIGHTGGDAELVRRVYFGTPHESYRRHIERLTQSSMENLGQIVWSPSNEESVSHVFDLLTGSFAEASLESGRLLHRLLILLCKDFYSPVSIGSAFSSLFPNEHYTQEGSANRVSQLVLRLRTWFSENDLGFAIESHSGNYKLLSSHGFGVRVPLSIPVNTAQSVVWTKIAPALKSGEFSRKQISELADCSPATAKRLLQWATANGLVKAQGRGTQTKYRIAS